MSAEAQRVGQCGIHRHLYRTVHTVIQIALRILSNDRDAVAKNVKVEGKAELLALLMKNMMEFPIRGSVPFNIVEP